MAVRRLPRRFVALDGEPKRPAVTGRFVGGATIALDAGNVETDEPKWQHVATTGSFKGYGGGELPFEFTATTFAQIVKNFRAHPSFVMGPDGVGTAEIVQWDFHHASEAPPDVVAQLGAPAQGWVLDLRTQVGANGAVELWALTKWLEPAKGYIKDGKYKWASVAVALDAVDQVSGAKIGAILTSIAITNQPFIEGMAELAAENKPGATPPAGMADRRANVKAAYPAYSISEAKECIRHCLGLPLVTTPEEISANLMTLAALLAGGEAMEEKTGIDADKVVGDIRTILGLPLLTPPAVIVKNALSIFDTEPVDTGAESETGNGDGESVPGATTATKNSNVTTKAGAKTNMDLKTLAAKLGVRETQEAVDAAVEGLVSIRASLTSSLSLDPNISDARLAESVKNVRRISAQRRNLVALVGVLATASFSKGKVKLAAPPAGEPDGDEPDGDEGMKPGKGDALVQRLGALMSAGGVEDPDRAVAQIVKTLTDAAKLEEVMPELEELRKFSTEAKAEAESEAVSATLRNYYNDDDSHRDAVVALYKSVGRVKFLEKYPALREDSAELAKTVAAENTHPTRGAAPAAAAPAAGGPVPTTVRATKRDEAPEGVVDISVYPGANDSERAINALKDKIPASKDWTYDDICASAFQARRSGRFVNLSAGR
jgi:hypothetical protein